MSTLRTTLALFAATALGLFAWTGCDSSGPAGPAAGSMTLRLTDAPLDNVDSVKVTIDRVTLIPSDEDDDDDGDDDSDDDSDDGDDDDGDGEDTEPIPVFEGPQTVDLLQLTNTSIALNEDVEIPEGSYNQMRFVLSGADEANYVVLNDGTKKMLRTPSAQSSGVKVRIPDIEVENDGDQIDVTLDFDASESISVNGGTYVLRPVIRAKSVMFNGEERADEDVSVSGEVTSVASDGSPVTVETVAFAVTSDTEFDDLSQSALSAGAFVEVEGLINEDGSYTAEEVESQGDDREYGIEGPLGSAASASLTVLGVTVQVDGETNFEGDLVDPSQLSPGDEVEVEFTKAPDGTRTAVNVEAESDDD
jgi:hypothetical protein